MNVDDLFDWGTNGTVALKPQAPKTTHRLEFYDNGPDCKAPVTQYGLVLDINGSTTRYNINFGVQSLNDLAKAHGAIHTTKAGQSTIFEMLDKALALPRYTDMATAKKNGLAGTGAHNLRAGAQAKHDHEVGAILVINTGRAPDVYLFINGVETALTSGWTAVRHSSHPNKLWEVRW